MISLGPSSDQTPYEYWWNDSSCLFIKHFSLDIEHICHWPRQSMSTQILAANVKAQSDTPRTVYYLFDPCEWLQAISVHAAKYLQLVNSSKWTYVRILHALSMST